jgi:hypothetical protein
MSAGDACYMNINRKVYTILLIIGLIATSSSCAQRKEIEKNADVSSKFLTKAQSTANATNNPESIDNNTNKLDTNDEQKTAPVCNLDNFYQTDHSLTIQRKNDDSTYEASKELSNTIIDLLSKTYTIDTNTAAGSEYFHNYSFNNYDYRLIFSGAKDILFQSQDGSFHFEGEKTIYKLYWDSDKFWKNVIMNNMTCSASLADCKVDALFTGFKEDINSDGETESIELIYRKENCEDSEGKLVIKVDGVEAIVGNQINWYTEPYHSVTQPPQLSCIPQIDEKSLLILVTITWDASRGVLLNPLNPYLPIMQILLNLQ